MPYKPKVCLNCSRTYRPTTSRGRYCNPTCAKDYAYDREIVRNRLIRGSIPLKGRTCRYCGNTFDAPNGCYRQRYCSYECLGEAAFERERERIGTIVNSHCFKCGCELPKLSSMGIRTRADRERCDKCKKIYKREQEQKSRCF